jgi:hypothetical protein
LTVAGDGSGGEKAALERQMEEFQKLIGEQKVEIRFLKRVMGNLRQAGRKWKRSPWLGGLTVKTEVRDSNFSNIEENHFKKIFRAKSVLRPKFVNKGESPNPSFPPPIAVEGRLQRESRSL